MFIVLFLSLPIWQVSVAQTALPCLTDYFNCVAQQRPGNPWNYRRPYADYNGAVRCLSEAGCDNRPDFTRGLFIDFLKIWQDVANKNWDEYVNTPENIKQCIRQIIVTYARARLDQCMPSAGGIALGAYPMEVELPYGGLPMPSQGDIAAMKAGLQEKVDVLHEINTCKETKGDEAAAKASTCLDAIRHASVVANYCNASSVCVKSKVSESCAASFTSNVVAMCQCAKVWRDQNIATIDQMYVSGQFNLLRLVPVFLGFDITKEISTQMQKCYTDNNAKPLSILKVLENPLLSGPFLNVQPRPQGLQAIRVLAYSQLDLPDFCDQCN